MILKILHFQCTNGVSIDQAASSSNGNYLNMAQSCNPNTAENMQLKFSSSTERLVGAPEMEALMNLIGAAK